MQGAGPVHGLLPVKKSKLKLQRHTLRPLAFGALGRVIGGDTTTVATPAVKSYVVPTGGVEPCRAEDTDKC